MTAPATSLKWIINLTIFLALLFLIAIVSVQIAALYDREHQQTYQEIATLLMGMGRGGWDFVRPFMQLVLILIIVDWILGKWGISWQSTSLGITWNVQTIIALVVVGAFAIAAMGGLGGVGALKDLALVVVGFYFGTQQKSVEMQTGADKVTVVEEHESERKAQMKEAEDKKEPSSEA